MSSWIQTTPKIFSRPVGENETFIKLVSDPGHALNREHWAINSTATIVPQGVLNVTTLPSQLRRAWGHLRFQHPSIATRVADDNINLLYEVPGRQELNDWIAGTFTLVEDAASSGDVIQNLKPGPYATLTYIVQSSELLGHTAHWRTDGIGVLLLLDALLELAADPDLTDPVILNWGEETARLAPAVEDAANIPNAPNAVQSSLGQSLVGSFAHAAGAVGIPYYGDGGTLPRGTLMAKTILDASLTQKVVEATKAESISVTSAIHASLASTNWAFAAEDRKKEHYTSTVRFSLRPYLPYPYCTPAYAAGLYTTGWMEKVEHSANWLEHARYFHELYQKSISREYIEAHRAYASGLGNMLRNLPQETATPSDVDISSIGIAEKLIGRTFGSQRAKIDVKAVSVGVEILTRQAVCFIWTFRDQLNLNVVYNEAFHAKEQMQDFVVELKSSLLNELGIDRV